MRYIYRIERYKNQSFYLSSGDKLSCRELWFSLLSWLEPCFKERERKKKIKPKHDCEHLSSDQSIPRLSSHSFTRKADGSQVWQGKAPGSLGTSIWTAGHPATGGCRCQMLPQVQGTEQTLKKNPQGLPKNLIWLRKLQTGREWSVHGQVLLELPYS